jgi:hypothetical protein
MKKDEFYIEIGAIQQSKDHEMVCGDVFLSRKIKEENRIITVLSDGLGSGVKANVLATLTATMGLNFTIEHFPPEQTAKTILETLPVDQARKISYATFTIVDIDADGETHIVNFDNPEPIILRDGKMIKTDISRKSLAAKEDIARELTYSSFPARLGDRVILTSDGVTQSGIGTATYPFGWDVPEVGKWICQLLEKDMNMSAPDLAGKIIQRALANDIYTAKDDISCIVIYFRHPRKLLLCSGPPYHPEDDHRLAMTIESFGGQKVLSGGTTAEIVSRELGRPIEVSLESFSKDIPPISTMPGIDLVTEGVLTLGRVSAMLEAGVQLPVRGKDAASAMLNLLLNNDQIFLLAGTRINEAHQDPTLPVELEIRRNVVKKIKRLLEDKYLKEVALDFI